MAARYTCRRTPIPDETAAEILFASDRTCCVCQDPARGVQIHHIDDNRNNHDSSNLAPLCLQCHQLTLVRGGFVRHLDAAQVRLYRADWENAVKRRRALRDSVSVEDIRKWAHQLGDIALSVTEPGELIYEPLDQNTGRYYRRLAEIVRSTRRGDRIAVMSHYARSDSQWAMPPAPEYIDARNEYTEALLDRAAAGVAYNRVMCFDCFVEGERLRQRLVRTHWLEHCAAMLALRLPSVWVKKYRACCGPDVFIVNSDTIAFSMEAPATRRRTYTAGALVLKGRVTNNRMINEVLSLWDAAAAGPRVTQAEIRQSLRLKRAAAF